MLLYLRCNESRILRRESANESLENARIYNDNLEMMRQANNGGVSHKPMDQFSVSSQQSSSVLSQKPGERGENLHHSCWVNY